MNERRDIPMVVEIDETTDINPLILGLASMLALKLIAKAKARAMKREPAAPPPAG